MTRASRSRARNGSKPTEFFTLACSVSQGLFSGERGVVVELPGRPPLAALVQKQFVTVEREPEPGSAVRGRVAVRVVSWKRDSAIVDLPEPGIAQGPRIEVPTELLQAADR